MMTRLVALTYSIVGGVAFVLSLSYFAYFFFFRLGPPEHSSDSSGYGHILAALATNVIFFTLFATHHSVMARSGAKRWLARHLPVGVERTTYVWISSVLFTLTCLLWRDLPGVLYAGTGWLRWAGYSAQLCGLLLIVWAVSVLDALDLSGIRQAEAAWTQGGTAAQVLRVEGPYRWVRHPIYLGWMLVVFGAPTMPTGRIAFAVISTAYLVLAIPWEERSMMETVGADYRRYVEQVRWRMLPGVY